MRTFRASIVKRLILLTGASIVPAFFIGCQEASLALQQALIQALAFRIGDQLFA